MANPISHLVRRGLSTSAIRCDLVRTPIPMFGLSGNYAHALYSASVKSKTKDKVATDLVMLRQLLTKQKVSDYMNDPFIPTTKKLDILKEVASKGGMTDTIVNFFGVLAENHRLNLMGDITKIFDRLMCAERGEVPATVTTAQALDAKQRKEIQAALAKFVKANEKVVMTEKVDSSIMGGMIVDIGDEYTNMKYIDMSTSSKIKVYLDLIKQPV
uniref:Oligomycin sensitivity conferral protein n=1 Tax=Phallusia mammillata TaxID=59560 RepID=A0A6F9D7T4_9ASCI|nr:ATP synthase subunit O, mitochondrial [Phallusia mammillata]